MEPLDEPSANPVLSEDTTTGPESAPKRQKTGKGKSDTKPDIYIPLKVLLAYSVVTESRCSLPARSFRTQPITITSYRDLMELFCVEQAQRKWIGIFHAAWPKLFHLYASLSATTWRNQGKQTRKINQFVVPTVFKALFRFETSRDTFERNFGLHLRHFHFNLCLDNSPNHFSQFKIFSINQDFVLILFPEFCFPAGAFDNSFDLHTWRYWRLWLCLSTWPQRKYLRRLRQRRSQHQASHRRVWISKTFPRRIQKSQFIWCRHPVWTMSCQVWDFSSEGQTRVSHQIQRSRQWKWMVSRPIRSKN